MGSNFFSHGYFVSPKYFLVGVLLVQNFFLWVFSGYFVNTFFLLLFLKGSFLVYEEE